MTIRYINWKRRTSSFLSQVYFSPTCRLCNTLIQKLWNVEWFGHSGLYSVRQLHPKPPCRVPTSMWGQNDDHYCRIELGIVKYATTVTKDIDGATGWGRETTQTGMRTYVDKFSLIQDLYTVNRLSCKGRMRSPNLRGELQLWWLNLSVCVMCIRMPPHQPEGNGWIPVVV